MAVKSAAKTKTKAKAKRILVIVESPAKAKTIEHYLGSGYTVRASMGHLIDLPKSRLAIDVKDHFQPEYITVRGRAKKARMSSFETFTPKRSLGTVKRLTSGFVATSPICQ